MRPRNFPPGNRTRRRRRIRTRRLPRQVSRPTIPSVLQARNRAAKGKGAVEGIDHAYEVPANGGKKRPGCRPNALSFGEFRVRENFLSGLGEAPTVRTLSAPFRLLRNQTLLLTLLSREDRGRTLMIPTKSMDYDLLSHDLPSELRPAGTVHRSEDLQQGLMLTGIVGDKEHDEVIPHCLLRQNLVVTAYPFRTTRSPRRVNH